MATVQELQEMEAQGNGMGDPATIEELAEDPAFGEEEKDTAISIPGAHQQLSLAVGGRKPDASTFKMKAAEVKVREGQYHKGETVELRVIARIDEIDFVDTHDEYGTVTATKRVHKAKPISVERTDEEADQ